MPVTAKTSSNLAKLGDISTFAVATSAVSTDPADSSGGVPTMSATFANGTDTEYLVGETVTVSAPSIGSFEGKTVSHSKAANSGTYSLSADSIMARLNADLRTYPLSDYNASEDSPWVPAYCVEYWTQQCGLFYTKVPGDVLLYQSGYGHFGLYAKDYTRALRSTRSLAVGGTAGGMYSRYGRVWTGFGYDFSGTATFPLGSYLPVHIPQSECVVFGADIDLVGTGNFATITWQFGDKSGAKSAVQISASSEEGFRLKSADASGDFSTRITSVLPKGELYSVYASVSQEGSDTRFGLTVFDRSGVLRDTQTVLFDSAVKGNLALKSVTCYGYLGGSGSELAYGNLFVSQMQEAPTKRIEDIKQVSLGRRGARFMVGFSGNAWEHIKQYCSIYHLDIGMVGGKLTIGPRQRDITVGASLSGLSTTIQNREQARNVEVVNQNHVPTSLTPTVLWKADSVYQVAVGEVQEFTVQTPHSILETSQPVCVSGISPYPYKTGAGQYVVTGSDGYIVSPTFWRDQGGSITTDTTENEGEIKVTIKGPDYDSPRAPYRISEGDAGRPALYVTGLGILASPETLKIGTGNARAAKDVGVSFDSPFVSSAQTAYDVAVEASKTFATPETTVAVSEPLAYDGVSKLGSSPVGAVVKLNGNILRVVSASQSPSVLTGSAVQHNTIYQLKRSFPASSSVLRKNYVKNPRGAAGTTYWNASAGTGGTASVAINSGTGPDGNPGFIRYTQLTANTSGSSGPYFRDTSGTFSGNAGTVRYVKAWVRSSDARSMRLTAAFKRTDSSDVGSVTGPLVAASAGVWTELPEASVTATADFTRFQVWPTAGASGTVNPVGLTIDVIALVSEVPGGTYFDGNYSNTIDKLYTWEGTSNLSVSRETAVTGTIKQQKTNYAGKTIGQVNIKPLRKVS